MVRAICPAARIISWEMDELSHIVCDGADSRQAVGTARSAARGAKRQAGRDDEAMDGTKNGTITIKQSSRVRFGGPCGAPTRDLRIANPLLSRLS